MTIKVTGLRQIWREVRQLPAERQEGVKEMVCAIVRVAQRDDFPMPGEVLRLYRPKVDKAERAACRQRVVDALQRGDAIQVICRRERVSRPWVYRVKASTARP